MRLSDPPGSYNTFQESPETMPFLQRKPLRIVGIALFLVSFFYVLCRNDPSSVTKHRQSSGRWTLVAEAAVVGIDFGEQYIKAVTNAPGRRFEIVLNAQSDRAIVNGITFETKEQLTMLGPTAPTRIFDTDVEQYAKKRFQTTYLYSNSYLGRSIEEAEMTPDAFSIVGVTHHQHFFPIEHIVDERRGTWKFRIYPDVDLSAEEVTANILWYVKKRVTSTLGGKMKDSLDSVITIPCDFNQRQRQSLVDAAHIAGLNVLGLVHNPLAAAITFALDKPVNKTTNILFYSMGSGRVDAGIVALEPIRRKDDPIEAEGQSLQLLSCKSFESLGGHNIDVAIAEYAAAQFEKAHGVSLREKPRALKALLDQAIKAKHKLSASKDHVFRVDSLYDGIDFSFRLSREDFEGILRDMNFDTNLEESVSRVLQAANLQLDQIDAFEILGGGWRIPSVQKTLSATIFPIPLSQHLNSDEAAGRGAAFIAANKSATFKTRHTIHASDVTPYSLHVKITSLEDVEQPDVAPRISRDTVLLKPLSRLSGVKKISLHSTENLQISLFESEHSKLLEVYTITGIKEALEGNYSEMGSPKIFVTFRVDPSGILRCSEAVAIFEETLMEPVVSPNATEAGASPNATEAGASPNATEAGASPNATEAGASPNATEAGASPNATEAGASPNATEADASPNATEADASPNATEAGAAAASSKPENEITRSTATNTSVESVGSDSAFVKRIVKHTVLLKVAVTAATPLPLTPSQKSKAKKVLAEFIEKDDSAETLSRERNSMESYIYSSRALLLSSFFQTIVPPDTLQSLLKRFSDEEDWLYETYNADFATVSSKLYELRNEFEPLVARAKEVEARPKVIERMNTFLKDEYERLTQLISMSPWLLKNVTDNALDFFSQLSHWWATVSKQQENSTIHDLPAFTEGEVEAKIKQQKVMRSILEQMPKPIPEINVTVANESNATAETKHPEVNVTDDTIKLKDETILKNETQPAAESTTTTSSKPVDGEL